MKIFIPLILTTYLSSNSIIVYNTNFAQVNETQSISLKKGRQSVKFNNLPNSLIIDSISPTFSSSNIQLISQSYKNNLLDITKLVEINLNNKVKFHYSDNEILDGTIVNVSPTIIKSDGEYHIVSAKSIIYNKLPSNIDNKPYLIWDLKSKKAEDTNVSLRYLIKGISWNGNYTLELKDKTLDLNAWATVVNKSGKSFKNTKISLIAGRVDKSEFSQPVLHQYRREATMSLSDNERIEPAIAEVPEVIDPNSIGGYYLYKIPNSTDLLNNQSTQTLLFHSSNIKYSRFALAVNKLFTRNGEKKLFFSQIIEFNNLKNNKLGKPLPEGLIRVYKKNNYVGSNYINNIPKGEKVALKTGKMFDIVGTKTIKKLVTKRGYKQIEIEYNIRNRGSKEMRVKLVEQIPKNNNTKFNTTCSGICIPKKKNAFVRQYRILIQPDTEYKFLTGYEINY